MTTIAIVGNGPEQLLPDMKKYKNEIDLWIGADRGAWTLIKNGIIPDYAVGDFDSINAVETAEIRKIAKSFITYPAEKDETDLEIALLKAYEFNPRKLYLIGATGGRLDHALANIQTLYAIINRNIQGIILDKYNWLEMTMPGKYHVQYDEMYPYISFIPYTENVKDLTLSGFYYPLENDTVSWGSTRCISNELLSKSGTFSYKEGILLLIKSRDAFTDTIPM